MKIKIIKFKKLENIELNIPAEISGGNGVGKSTILEAISFVLTGKNLSGKEFEQLYDNRVDLHEAVADVSYFDNYGNEYRRTVSPVFSTNRQGVEEIKIKCNTVCKKNDIAVNDFSAEFSDFAKYGTDYFFNQKQEIQRSIFIDVMKNSMPVYDVNASSLKLKELKKSQKLAVEEIESYRKLQKETKDVEIPSISSELQKQNNEFLLLSKVDNSADLAEINKRNNIAYQQYQTAKNHFTNAINSNNSEISKLNLSIQSKESDLKQFEQLKFTSATFENSDELQKRLETLKTEISTLKYYENLNAYYPDNFDKNPILVANRNKILELEATKTETSESKETESLCPLNNEFCGVAKSHSITSKVLRIKAENKSILEKEMNEANSNYIRVKTNIEAVERSISEIKDRNSKLEAKNKEAELKFKTERNFKCAVLKDEIKENVILISRLEANASLLEKELSKITEPTIEKLPEATEISEELKQAHLKFEAENKIIIENSAINSNNAKNKQKWETEIKNNQTKLFEIDAQIVKLTAEISDYFSKLDGIVKKEFAGEIEIGVELLEYVISKDEYKDCFKITANGKVYPYETNGALQNNVKLQVLATIQRLKGYNGVALIDNTEANTTDKINTNNLQLVLARATNENILTIK